MHEWKFYIEQVQDHEKADISYLIHSLFPLVPLRLLRLKRFAQAGRIINSDLR